MLKVKMLYHPFHLKKSYEDINEEKILSSVYLYKKGTLEEAISRIINEAVLNHMNLNIDSTIMQMHALNEHLSQLFMNNLDIIIFNYLIYNIEYRCIEEVEEEVFTKIQDIASKVSMKTDLDDLNLRLDELCQNLS